MKEQDDEWWEAEKILDMKQFNARNFYLIKWKDWDQSSWEPETNLNCPDLIEEYEKSRTEQYQDQDSDEWEVEAILDKRETPAGKTEYYIKWRNWNGSPTWEPEELCDCVNLIAAFENPDLRTEQRFMGNITELWMDEQQMYAYLDQKYSTHVQVNVAKLKADMPDTEEKLALEPGLNVSVSRLENHWFLIIAIYKHKTFCDRIIICDSLNRIMSNTAQHPVYKRLKRMFKRTNIKPIPMSQQTRSDVCSYYALAAFDRALFLLNDRAPCLIDEIFVSEIRAELIREEVRPDTHGLNSPALPIPEPELSGPRCEFCKKHFIYQQSVDIHIEKDHFKPLVDKGLDRRSSTEPRKSSIQPRKSTIELRKKSIELRKRTPKK